MKAVVNATTLIGLSRIKQLHLLEKLFEEVYLSKTVYDEVAKEGKPGAELISKVTGTIGILLECKKREIIPEIKPLLDELRDVDFWRGTLNSNTPQTSSQNQCQIFIQDYQDS